MQERVNHLLPGQSRWPVDPDEPVIQLRGVSKRFDGRLVLDGLNLDIHTGITTVIAGESGSGKSVLLKLMNGLMLPDEGQVLLFGRDTRKVDGIELLALRKRITMMFQNYALMDSMTVYENVAFPLYENTRMRWKTILPLAQELLDMLGLSDAGEKLPSEISGGMKKRVSLARAIISNPEVVLFDEPTTGLDPVMIEFVDKMIVEARERFGITSVIISHDMTSTVNLADKLAILEDGKISLYGTVEEVIAKPTPLVEVFFEDIGRLDSEVEADTRPGHAVYALEPGETAIAELHGVHKSFGPHHVLRGVDLVVPRDKITVIIGGSGSGKSVIMKHIIGLMQPDRGTIRVFDVDLGSLNTRQLLSLRERYGMVFQGAALLDAMTVEGNIGFPLRERRAESKSVIKDRIDEMLRKLRLTDIAHRMPSEISNGQRKRVGLARAMITQPELIIYDEPTTGQDPVLTRYLDDMIVEAQALFDVTSLVVSHDMPSAFRTGDQIAMLHKGQILAAESPAGLREVEDPRVRRFIYAGTREGEVAAAEIVARKLS
ncbi:MAG: phospholipid/cholesterol/gamma-HCH transport system ATP-binding protein [Myxococcota bacterium]|jgi:phospholipid/cholesterol/gamma-HCH transport system ATP-binding protein